MLKVLHIANNSAYSDNPISTAMREEGFDVYEIDYLKFMHEHRLNFKRFSNYVCGVADNLKPNFTFMQIQNDGIIDFECAFYVSKICPLINYSGDVRNDTNWHELMGSANVLTLLNNDEDISHLRSLGFKADYLQIGFHTDIHNPKHRDSVKKGKIVFIGSNYGTSTYPLGEERIELCKALNSEFGDDFALYGQDWQYVGLKATPIPSDLCSKTYSAYDIAINHSHYQRSRYSSDRLFYILGSGTFCLSQTYPRMEEEFVLDEHLAVYKNIPDLIEKCHYWLDPKNADLREKIARQGCEYVHNNCNWNVRIKELKNILTRYYPTI